jgi:hypothetical protein
MDSGLVNTTTAMLAENNLLSVRDNIEKNKTKITTEEDSLKMDIRTKARACKGGTKEQRAIKLKKLLPLMQRYKRYRQQNALANQQLNLLNAQLNAFENGRFQKEMTDTLRYSVVAMKKVGISDNEDAVHDIVDDLQDTITLQNQISESLSLPLVNSMDENSTSDDSLMRELMALVGDDTDEQDTSIAAVPDSGGVAQYVTIIPPDQSDVSPAVMEVGTPISTDMYESNQGTEEDPGEIQDQGQYHAIAV